MADEKTTISQSKSVGDWVKAYLDDDSVDLSKAKKFQHLQRISQFGAFCYMVENNSKKAHIDFFDTNYTHMDTQVAKASEFISRLLQLKYGKFPAPLNSADFHSVNTSMRLFPSPTAQVIQDYLELANDFDKHIPHYPNPADTENMLKELNKDMPDVQSDHIRLLHATGASSERNGSLKREEIYGILDVATETVAGIWKDAKKEKSTAEKNLMKEQEAAVGKRVDLGIKTAKVGLLGAAGVGCIGAVVSGIFLPALGLIPIFVLAKRWLPDLAKSVGSLYDNFKKRVAARYNIKKADVKQRYIEKGPSALSWKELNVMLSPGDKILLDKQRKSFNLFYGKDSIKEMTMDYLNLGQLENPKEIDNMVPADIRDMLQGKVRGINPSSTSADLVNVAKDLKNFEAKLPNDADTQRLRIDYYEKAREHFNDVLFNNAYTPSSYPDANDLFNDPTMSESLKASGYLGIDKKVENSLAFTNIEKNGYFCVNPAYGDAGGIKVLGDYGVPATSLYTTQQPVVINACAGLGEGAAVAPVVARIFSNDANTDYAAIVSEIDTAAPTTTSPKTNKYLKHMLEIRRNSTSLNNADISVKDVVRIAGGTYQIDDLIVGLKMKTANDGLSEIGKFVTVDNIPLEIIRSSIVAKFPNPADQAKRDEALRCLDEQVKRLEFAHRIENAETMISILKAGSAGTFADTIKKIDGFNYSSVNDAKNLYADLTSKLKKGAKLEYLLLKMRDKMENAFIDEARNTKYSSASEESLKNVVSFMQEIRKADFFNEGQKARLFKTMEVNLESALNRELQSMEEDLLKDVEKPELRQKLKWFLERSYGEGFKEFFETNSPASVNVKNRITRLQKGLELTSLLSAGGQGGSPVIIDRNKNDTKVFLGIYFDGATKQDNVLSYLRELETISTNSNFGHLKADSVENNPNCFVNMLSTKVGEIMAAPPATLSHQDKLAIMLVAKKRALAMLKAHMRKYADNHRSNMADDMAGIGSNHFDNIKAGWSALLADIDTHIGILSMQPACDKFVNGVDCRGTLATLNSIGYDTIAKFYGSNEAQPGRA